MIIQKYSFVIIFLFIFSCEKQATDSLTDPNVQNLHGNMKLQIDMSQAPTDVFKLLGTLSRENFADVTFGFEINGESATALVEELAAGLWNLKVDAYNRSNIIIYTGSTDIYVTPNSITPVTLRLDPATGSVLITVIWNSSDREWGEIVYGIRTSINLDDKELKPYDKSYSNIIIENVSGDSIFFEAYVSFCLYDKDGVLRYQAYVNLAGRDSVDYYHPKSMISFKDGNPINRTFEITGLLWVSPISSRPPETNFYHLVQSGQYILQLQIEPILPTLSPIPTIFVLSNQILLNIKSAESEKLIYYNSFESAEDTAGFGGYGYYDFKGEPSPNGGEYSLYVSGGCIWPHVMVNIPAQESDGYYRLEGWGRNLEIGGTVELHNNLRWREESIYFSVSDSVWLYCTSDSILFCPAGQSMSLMMGAGGFVPSAMLVDQIKVIRIK